MSVCDFPLTFSNEVPGERSERVPLSRIWISGISNSNGDSSSNSSLWQQLRIVTISCSILLTEHRRARWMGEWRNWWTDGPTNFTFALGAGLPSDRVAY